MKRRLDRWHRLLLIACCLALFGVSSCHRAPAANELFPPSNEAAGWVKSSDTRTFEAADLWKYIDGEAERYLQAQTRRVFTADYKYQSQIEGVVDIYVMESADGTRKIFDSEPSQDAKSVPLGDGARLYDQSLIFHKGRYLVRIVAYQGPAGTAQDLLELGRVIEGRITR